MKKLIILTILLLFSTLSYAETFVCQIDSTPDERNHVYRRSGDCLNLGFCSGVNNTGLDVNCIIATEGEAQAVGSFKKIDKSATVGSRVVTMTQAEQDAIIAAETQAQLDADRARADRLDFTIEDVLVALVKRINVRIPGNPITKQEVIDQLKADKGL